MNQASTNAADHRATVAVRILTGSKAENRPHLLKLARAGIAVTCRNGGVWVATGDAAQAEQALGFGR